MVAKQMTTTFVGAPSNAICKPVKCAAAEDNRVGKPVPVLSTSCCLLSIAQKYQHVCSMFGSPAPVNNRLLDFR
jgi:hypothetical protein